METINVRVQDIVNQLFRGNTSSFCRAFDLRQGTVKDILGVKQSSPSYETIRKIISNAEYKINAEWLLLAAGKMIKGELFTSDESQNYNELKEELMEKTERIYELKKIITLLDEKVDRLEGAVKTNEVGAMDARVA